MYLHRERNFTIRKAANLTITKIFVFWQRASIPVKQKQNAITKLEKYFQKWQSLQKRKLRNSDNQRQQEEAFKECLDNLFDVAHAQALHMMTSEEDKKFLLAKREKGRRGCMAELNVTTVRKVKRHQVAQEKNIKRRRRAEKKASRLNAIVSLEHSSGSSTKDDLTTQDDYCPKAKSSCALAEPSKRKPKKLITANLSSGLDRTNVTDRAAMIMISETAKSLGHDLNEFALSGSTIRRSRRDHRKNLATEMLKTFSPQVPLTIHWDGKLLPDLSNSKIVDRLPILVSAHGETQLLPVPKLPFGTGEAQAQCNLSSFKRMERLRQC